MTQIELSELAGGAMQEKIQLAMQEVFRNMQDPNTPYKNKRAITVKMAFSQNEDRNDVKCEISVEKKLAAPKPVATAFMVETDLRTGTVEYTEYGSGMRGQMSLADYPGIAPVPAVDSGSAADESAPIDFKAARQA